MKIKDLITVDRIQDEREWHRQYSKIYAENMTRWQRNKYVLAQKIKRNWLIKELAETKRELELYKNWKK